MPEVVLFNLRKSQIMEGIYDFKMEQDEIREELEADEPEQFNEAGGQSIPSPGLPELEFSDEEDYKTLTEEEKAKQDKWKLIRRRYNNFVSKLQIPCYKRLSYYYYFDVLESFCRMVFQQDLEGKKLEVPITYIDKTMEEILEQVDLKDKYIAKFKEANVETIDDFMAYSSEQMVRFIQDEEELTKILKEIQEHVQQNEENEEEQSHSFNESGK